MIYQLLPILDLQTLNLVLKKINFSYIYHGVNPKSYPNTRGLGWLAFVARLSLSGLANFSLSPINQIRGDEVIMEYLKAGFQLAAPSSAIFVTEGQKRERTT
jgi:hypothetical protein